MAVSNNTSWYPYDKGKTLGKEGSERGFISQDEEYDRSTRITLERDGNTPFAITCGIYDWMVHTRFFSAEEEAQAAFEEMKIELAKICDALPSIYAEAEDPEIEDRYPGRKEKYPRLSDMLRDFIESFP